MQRMRLIVPLVLAALFGLLSWTGADNLAVAQTAAESAARQKLLADVPAASLDEHGAELVTRIRNGLDTYDQYIHESANANPEDSLVLQLQITALQVRMTADVHELADVLIVLEETGPQEQLRTEVEEVLTYSPPPDLGLYRAGP